MQRMLPQVSRQGSTSAGSRRRYLGVVAAAVDIDRFLTTSFRLFRMLQLVIMDSAQPVHKTAPEKSCSTLAGKLRSTAAAPRGASCSAPEDLPLRVCR